MKRALLACCAALLAGCATQGAAPGMVSSEVSARMGKPSAEGRLPNGDAYWDYSRQPYAIDRVVFGADQRVREVRNLLTPQNFANLRPGLTPDEVAATVGPTSTRNRFANGTTEWTYRYHDLGVAKLLQVVFDPSGRLALHYTQWDPDVYSKIP